MRKDLYKGIFLMILSALATCTGQLMWKLSSVQGNTILYMLLGFALYGTGALLMIFAFRFGEVSVLQPMLSIGFVISLFLAVLVLKEDITVQKVIGVLLIIAGMIFLGRGGTETEK